MASSNFINILSMIRLIGYVFFGWHHFTEFMRLTNYGISVINFLGFFTLNQIMIAMKSLNVVLLPC